MRRHSSIGRTQTTTSANVSSILTDVTKKGDKHEKSYF